MIIKGDKMNRRRHRSRKRYAAKHGRTLKAHAVTVAIVIFLSVAAGYFTATQLLGPALGLETQQTFFDFIKDKQDSITENNDKKDGKDSDITVVEDKAEPETENGFALQYGSFSAKSGAKECAEDLKSSGIDAEIIEKDGMYKVIGNIFDTKQEAESYREKNPQKEEVFITEIN